MAIVKVGFSKPKKWMPFSWLIMTGYGTPYSHVYIKYRSDKFNRDLVYQASGTTVNFMGPAVFADHAQVVREFDLEISEEARTKMITFAIDNAGKPYGVKNAVGLMLVRICEIFGKRIDNPFTDDGTTYVCCELVAAILKECLEIDIEADVNLVTPKEMYDLLTKLTSRPNT